MKPARLKILPWLALPIALSGCMSVTPTHDIYGNDAYYVECNLGPKNICYAKLENLCPDGYYIIDKNMDGALPLGIGSYKNITIRCRK